MKFILHILAFIIIPSLVAIKHDHLIHQDKAKHLLQEYATEQIYLTAALTSITEEDYKAARQALTLLNKSKNPESKYIVFFLQNIIKNLLAKRKS